jgi:hypothetical protein
MTAMDILERRPNVAEHQTPNSRGKYRQMLRKLFPETDNSQEGPKEYSEWMSETARGLWHFYNLNPY